MVKLDYCSRRVILNQELTLNGAEQAIFEVRDLFDASMNEARFVAAAGLCAMQGQWQLHRKIASRILQRQVELWKGQHISNHGNQRRQFNRRSRYTLERGHSR